MTDTWNTATAQIAPDAAIRSNDVQLYGGTTFQAHVFALTNIGHNLAVNKYYCECNVLDASPAADVSIGFGIDTDTSGLGTDNLSLFDNGDIYNGGTIVHHITVPPTGFAGVVSIAVGGNQIWWRINGGPWNDSVPGADPATGAGGFTINSVPVYWILGQVFGDPPNPPTLMNINTGPAFAYPPPAGFAPWFAAADVPVQPGPPSVSAGSPNPPAPNPIAPGAIDTRPWHGQPVVG